MEITNASALVIHPGDRVVLMFPDNLSQNERDHAIATWKDFSPDTPCFILDGGASIAVVCNESAAVVEYN